MKTFNQLFCLGFVTFLFSSCITMQPSIPYNIPQSRQEENVFYFAPSQNVPLLTNKNDVSARVKYEGGTNHSAISFQVALMPTKHIGVIASHSSGDDGNYRNNEFGAGYVSTLDSSWNFEIYAGFGRGTIENKHATGTSSLRSSYYFLQPTISVLDVSKTLQFAFIPKFVFNRFSVIDTTFKGARETYNLEQLKIMDDKPNQIFFEPGIQLKLGGKNFMMQASYQTSLNMTSQDLNYNKAIFSLGACLRLNAKKK